MCGGGWSIRKKSSLTWNKTIQPGPICGESTGYSLLPDSMRWLTGATAPTPAAEILGIRLPESLVFQTATDERLPEPVLPNRRRGAPCKARLQARCLGNHQAKRPPATTNRKPWASWPLITVARSLGTAPVGARAEWLPVEQTKPRPGLHANASLPLCLSDNGPIRTLVGTLHGATPDGKTQLSARSLGVVGITRLMCVASLGSSCDGLTRTIADRHHCGH